MNVVIEGLHPFSVVHLQSFKTCVYYLQPEVVRMPRGTIATKVEKVPKQMKSNLKAARG